MPQDLAPDDRAGARMNATASDARATGPVTHAVLFAGVVYLVIGLVSASLAGAAESMPVRNAWRWAAWVASALTFAAHFRYERFWWSGAARPIALRVGSAVALGAFGLAAIAAVRGLAVGTSNPFLWLVALVLWPVGLGVPAFLVAFIAAAVLPRRSGILPRP